MTFDFTKGKKTKYIVFIYMPDGCYDRICYHYFNEAKNKFNQLCESEHYERGTAFSLFDANKFERKAYKRKEI